MLAHKKDPKAPEYNRIKHYLQTFNVWYLIDQEKSHGKCFIKDKNLMKCVQGTCNVEAAFEELDEIFHIV